MGREGQAGSGQRDMEENAAVHRTNERKCNPIEAEQFNVSTVSDRREM